jgi:hypothetical protein
VANKGVTGYGTWKSVWKMEDRQRDRRKDKKKIWFEG